MKLYRSDAFTEEQFIQLLNSDSVNYPQFCEFKKNNILIYSTGPVGYMGSIPKKSAKVTIYVPGVRSHPIQKYS